MYTIYVDSDLIYAPALVDDGYYAINPTLDMELNLASTLEFGLSTSAVGYNKIKKLKSIIKVYEDDTRIFRGRCLSDELTIMNQKNIHCEGELGFLQDSIVRSYTFTGTVSQFFTFLINGHNAQVDADKRFAVGNVTVGDYHEVITRESGSYQSTFDEINNQLLEQLGGYIVPRYEVVNGVEVEYLDYLSDSGGQNSQVIEFGNNMIDFSQKLDGQEIFTVLVPLGEIVGDDELERRLTIASVNSGKDYLEDAEGILRFGRICKSMIWDDETDASVLKTRGQSALSSRSNIVPQIELSAIDLHMLDVNISSIRLGQYNRVVSTPHGVDAWFQCARESLDLENPEQSLYSFGVAPKTLTALNTSEQDKISAVINQVSGTIVDIKGIHGDISVISESVEDISGSVEEISDTVGDLSTKSDTIEEGAQVNTIETIMVNGVPVEIINKTVNITIPT